MTEREAMTKWCPMVRSLVYDAQGQGVCAANQVYRNEAIDIKLAYCKGSQCMMWRSTYTDSEMKFGYCGLAGTYGG